MIPQTTDITHLKQNENKMRKKNNTNKTKKLKYNSECEYSLQK